MQHLLNVLELLILPFSSYNDFLSFELSPGYFRYFGAVSLSSQWCKESSQYSPDQSYLHSPLKV